MAKAINNGLSNQKKQEWAQYLYVENKKTQKEIAETTGVSQKTITKWKETFQWDKLRKSLLTTRKEQLMLLYNQLDATTTMIRDVQKNIPTSKDADSILKLTAAIRNLETDLSIADVFEVGKEFITFVQSVDYEKSKEIVEYYDSFIKHRLNRS